MECLQFLLDTIKGFLVAAVIPIIVFFIYSIIKSGGLNNFLKGLSYDNSRTGIKKSEEAESKCTDDEWGRTWMYKPRRIPKNEWFRKKPIVVCGFQNFKRVTQDMGKIQCLALFWLELVRGLVLYFFLGHMACIVLTLLIENGWEELIPRFMLINVSFFQWHLILATVMAFAEFILSIAIYIFESIECSVSNMLSKIRDYLCKELGEEKGTEAARFLALLLDFGLDRKDSKAIKMMACKNRRASGKDFTQYLVTMYESKLADPDLRQSIQLTEEGMAIYKKIRKTL